MTGGRATLTSPQTVPDAITALVRLLARQAARDLLDGSVSPSTTSETVHDRQD